MNKKVVYIGSDHGGFELREKVKKWLEEWKYSFKDFGAFSLDPEDDYPLYAFTVAKKVARDENSVGILLCRSGGGMITAANKVRGIRAVFVYDKRSAVHAREHDDANVISISADWTNEDQEKEILLAFLQATFKGEERHKRRINEIMKFESRGD